MKVKGSNPQTLKLTHVVSGWVLQIISFNIAKNIKKNAHLLFSFVQPSSFNLKADLKKNSKKFFFINIFPKISENAKIRLTIVGFMYIKTGLSKYKVSPPKRDITIPPSNGI